MSEAFTEIHRVRDLQQAFRVARGLGVAGIGLDIENTLTPYVGKTPHAGILQSWPREQEDLTVDFMHTYPNIAIGLMTNNPNTPYDTEDNYDEFGFVDEVAHRLSRMSGRPVPYVYKGMPLSDGTFVKGKPSGHQGLLLAERLGIDPSDVALVDDQGIKNAGTAVEAGLRAIIVPDPIGIVNSKGRVLEHSGVMRLRPYEDMIYRSLEKGGNLALGAYQMLAGVHTNQFALYIDHRKAA